jgi:alpha-beta hydrolase superfamily lysophospholipase
MFLGALDQTIVATALPTIGRHFGNLEDLSWVVTAYLLTWNGCDAALRQARGHPRSPRRHAHRDRHFRDWFGCLCALAPTMSALVLSRGFRASAGAG